MATANRSHSNPEHRLVTLFPASHWPNLPLPSPHTPSHPPPLTAGSDWLPSGVVRASSIFPILSAVLLLLGGLCVAASRLQRARTSLVLGAGILFVAAGLWGS